MAKKDGLIQEFIKKRLADSTATLPTSVMGRLGRTALTGLRGGRLLLFKGGADDTQDMSMADMEALTKMIQTLGQMKGIAMKFGQILSYIDIDVPPQMREALSVLQTQSPPMPFEIVERIIREDLGDRAEILLAGMDRVPAASASIGQVHCSRLPDGTKVAVKVRYPDIDKAIAADFKTAAVGTAMASTLFPGAKIESMMEEAKTRFLLECDYAHEARVQGQFRQIYEGHPTVVVPAVHLDFCASRVLTTTWMDGMTFDQYLASNPSQTDRDRIGIALFEFYIGSLFTHGLYNCDPHPGNYVFMGDGKVAVLDYGCTREFDHGFRQHLTGLTRAVHSDRHDDLHQAFLAIGMVRPDRHYDFDTARQLVRAFFGPMLRDEVQVISTGEAITFRAATKTKFELMKLSLPGEFLFLFRIRFGLMSILAHLGARANWYQLERGFVDAAAKSS